MMLFDMMKELGLGLILGFMVNLILAVTNDGSFNRCVDALLQTFITICSFCISF